MRRHIFQIYFRYGFFLPDDQVIRVFQIFVNWVSMTNANVYQRFHDDKKVEEHCARWKSFCSGVDPATFFQTGVDTCKPQL